MGGACRTLALFDERQRVCGAMAVLRTAARRALSAVIRMRLAQEIQSNGFGLGGARTIGGGGVTRARCRRTCSGLQPELTKVSGEVAAPDHPVASLCAGRIPESRITPFRGLRVVPVLA